jgi:hypothetical protein
MSIILEISPKCCMGAPNYRHSDTPTEAAVPFGPETGITYPPGFEIGALSHYGLLAQHLYPQYAEYLMQLVTHLECCNTIVL